MAAKQAMTFITDFKEDLKNAITPQLKKAVCESARILASSIFKGFWLKFVLVVINIMESTIKI